jgi:phosphatidylglycerol:prolipoprotein diacylglycerol transferase
MPGLIPVGLVPFYEPFVWTVGPLVLDSWALLVSIGFIVGLEVARARGIKNGLDVRDVVDSAVFVVGMGFVVGHLVHVLAYNPHQLEEQGITALLKVWAGFSSTGGFIGAVLGCVLMYVAFPRWFGPVRDRMAASGQEGVGRNMVEWLARERAFWPHADTLMYGFPFAWTFGRLGCFSAHDHVGRASDFFLAVDFPQQYYGGPRHDLGLYEALWTAVIAATFYALRKQPVKPGFFTALWCVLYFPARFGFDFLRHTDMSGADVRWVGLTPAQWGALLLFGAGLFVLRRTWGGASAGEE